MAQPGGGGPVGAEPSSPLGTGAADDALFPGAGVRGFAAQGSGEQIVWCDPDRDLVAVVRWVTDPTPVLAAITAAVPTAT